MEPKRTMDRKELVSGFLSLVFNDVKLSTPVYVEGIESEEDADSRSILPLLYIWNEDRAKSSFSFSVNGRIVGYLLESFIERSDPRFCEIRDEIMASLSYASQNAVVKTCEKMCCWPSDAFGPNKNPQRMRQRTLTLCR